MSERATHIKDFLSRSGYGDAELHPLAGDASFRRYIRIRKGDQKAMLMDAPPEKEDVRPFMHIAKHLVAQGYSAPKILAEHPDAGFLLLEDLGDDSFTGILKSAPDMQHDLYAAAIDVLAAWHKASDLQTLVLPLYDEALLMREVSLFTDWFLPQILGPQKAASLRPEYLELWQSIFAASALATNVFVHRDYHADNLMWLPARAKLERVGLLDFQDGVYGDGAYDLVSLLEDARRDVPPALADEMLARYIAASGADRTLFLQNYALLGAQRNSKIVGIFSRLAARDGKLNYLNFLPRVWQHLERDLAHPTLQPLRLWIDKHVPASYRGVISIQQECIA